MRERADCLLKNFFGSFEVALIEFGLRQRGGNHQILGSIRQGALEMLRRGITSVHDDAYHVPIATNDSVDAIMRAYQDAGIRATVAIDQPNIVEYDKYPYLADLLPAAYRDWIFLTSGVDMSYSENSAEAGAHTFDNVFAPPAAYAAFQRTGVWPDQTMLILENRAAKSKGSINRQGLFQTTEVVGIEAHVKDAARFKGGWAFFAFGGDTSEPLDLRDAPFPQSRAHETAQRSCVAAPQTGLQHLDQGAGALETRAPRDVRQLRRWASNSGAKRVTKPRGGSSPLWL